MPAWLIQLFGLSLALSLSACHGGSFGSNSATDQVRGVPFGSEGSLDFDARGDFDLDVIVENAKGDDQIDSNNPDDGKDDGEADQRKKRDKNCSESKKCAKMLGIGLDRIKVAGSQNQVRLETNEALVVKITGDQNSFSLNLAGDSSDEGMAGVCIFMAGNQAKVDISAQIPVGSIHLISRGNQPEANISVASGAKVSEISWNARGNQPKLNISGEGDFVCPSQGFRGELNCDR